MKLLITGAKGQIGSQLIHLGAQRENFQLFAAGRDEMDVADKDSVSRVFDAFNPHILINAAAYTAVDNAETETEQAHEINARALEILVEHCRDTQIPLLHISTDYVFDGESSKAYRESDPTNPLNVYGASKLAGERVVQAYERHILLRVSWVFGASGNNFVKTMIRLARQRDSLAIVDDQTGCPTWSRDIARVLLDLAQDFESAQTLPWGTYHYCGTPGVSWYQFAAKIFAEAKQRGILAEIPELRPIKSDEFPTAALRPRNTSLDCSRIAETFGISRSEWEIGLKNTLSQSVDT